MHELVDIYNNIHITGPIGLICAIAGVAFGYFTSETKEGRGDRALWGGVWGTVIGVIAVTGGVLH
jgi:hypothetical protein